MAAKKNKIAEKVKKLTIAQIKAAITKEEATLQKRKDAIIKQKEKIYKCYLLLYLKRYKIRIGDEVVSTGGTAGDEGKIFKILDFQPNGVTKKPWITASPKMKSGKFSEKVRRHLYEDWEKA